MPRTTIVLQTEVEPTMDALEEAMGDVARRLGIRRCAVLSWVVVAPQYEGEPGSRFLTHEYPED